ncbi:hypothetical protein BDV93DRAFT_525056, partial [Ceratobasidium sp. AG-I]
MNTLPSELISHIFNHLGENKSSQLKFALSNTRICHLVTPLIYERVVVSDSHTIWCFCNTINGSNRNLGAYIKHLHLESPCAPTAGDMPMVARAIFAMLNRLVNLRELEFLHHEDLFLWDPVSPIYTRPMLQLTCLKAVSYSGAGFARFLNHQSTLVSLNIVEPCCRKGDSYIQLEATNQPFLPALKELTASIPHVIEIVPNRYIQKVIILPSGRTRTRRLDDLVNALCNSLSPLVSIDFWLTHIAFDAHPGWVFVDLLSKTKIAAGLRFLTIGMRIL